MSYYAKAIFDKSARPNRCQHLVVSDSRHLYLKGGHEELGYQKKELDPRTCGNRRMVTRLIAVDEDTGAFYGELWPRGVELDLSGFLGRAWARKKDFGFHGVPGVLLIPARVSEDRQLMAGVVDLARVAGVDIGPAPGGWGPATNACKEFERTILNGSLLEAPLVAVQMASALISSVASFNSLQAFSDHWKSIPEMPESVFKYLDGMYVEPGDWRLGQFERVMAARAAG
jgi:hypothetical protein